MEKLILFLLFLNLLFTFRRKQDFLACGLVGFSGEKPFVIEKIQMLMIANTTRGKHSTGVYNKGVVTKEAVDAVTFLAKHKLSPENLFIGHDRYATIGLKNAENAHPFEVGNTILVHNGTLTNHWQLARAANLNINKISVDSEVIANLINLDEDESFIVLKNFDGAAALIWTDKTNPSVLRVFRNEERPLFYGKSNEGLYISSIEDSLKIIGCYDIKSFSVNKVYFIENGKINKKKSISISRKKKTSIYTQGSSYPYGNNYGYGNNYRYGNYYEYNNPYKNNELNVSHRKRKVKEGWVKANGNGSHLFTAGKYYKVVKDDGTGYFDVLRENNTKSIVSKSLFFPRKEINKEDFVVAMESSENNVVEKGNLFYVREIDDSSKEIKLELEHLSDDDDDQIIVWGASHFRLATEEEQLDFLQTIDEDVDFLEESTNEELAKILLDEKYIDELHSIWISIGDIYEIVIKAKMSLNELSDWYNLMISQGGVVSLSEGADLITDLSFSIEEILKQFDSSSIGYNIQIKR